MIDELAIHIRKVELAIRPSGREHRVKPGIGARQEISAFRCAPAAETRAIRFRDLALHEILCRLADKPTALECSRQALAIELVQPAGAGERAGMWRAHQLRHKTGSRQIRADREYLRFSADGRNILRDLVEIEIIDALPPMWPGNGVHDWISIRGKKSATDIVHHQSELRVAADGFRGGATGTKAKVAAFEIHRRKVRPFRRANHAGAPATRNVDPAVRPERGIAGS